MRSRRHNLTGDGNDHTALLAEAGIITGCVIPCLTGPRKHKWHVGMDCRRRIIVVGSVSDFDEAIATVSFGFQDESRRSRRLYESRVITCGKESWNDSVSGSAFETIFIRASGRNSAPSRLPVPPAEIG